MRAPIVLALAALILAGCGSTEKKTVIVTPPGSTTVVDQNGNAHVVEHAPPP